ncbi:DUF6461 domain-containing protein [Nonomuraea muscovyensis]
MRDPLAPFRWLEASPADERGLLGEIFCVSLVRRLDPAEVLSRLDPVSPAETMTFAEVCGRARACFEEAGDVRYVGVAQIGQWSVAVEPWGGQAALSTMTPWPARAGEVVGVGRSDYARHRFAYAVDGTVATAFDPAEPERRWGDDPDRLNRLMREAGLEVEPPADESGGESWHGRVTEHPVARAFALAAGITGVALTWTAVSGLPFAGAALRHERGRGGRRATGLDRSADIRRWAEAHGLPMSERGRIAATVAEQAEDLRDPPGRSG